jgi:hypothetical protein
MKVGDIVQVIDPQSHYYGEAGTIIFETLPGLFKVLFDGRITSIHYQPKDLKLIQSKKEPKKMRIGDKIKIPMGSRKGQEAIIRDIKGSNIWVYLPGETSPAVMFQIGDFPNDVVFNWLDSQQEQNTPKPEKPNFWIIQRAGGGVQSNNQFWHENEALDAINRYAKANPGATYYMLAVVRKVSYAQTLSKQETVY